MLQNLPILPTFSYLARYEGSSV